MEQTQKNWIVFYSTCHPSGSKTLQGLSKKKKKKTEEKAMFSKHQLSLQGKIKLVIKLLIHCCWHCKIRSIHKNNNNNNRKPKKKNTYKGGKYKLKDGGQWDMLHICSLVWKHSNLRYFQLTCQKQYVKSNISNNFNVGAWQKPYYIR